MDYRRRRGLPSPTPNPDLGTSEALRAHLVEGKMAGHVPRALAWGPGQSTREGEEGRGEERGEGRKETEVRAREAGIFAAPYHAYV